MCFILSCSMKNNELEQTGGTGGLVEMGGTWDSFYLISISSHGSDMENFLERKKDGKTIMVAEKENI